MFTTRRGLLAPQNTFLDTIIRKCDGQNSCFLLTNARILDFPIVYVSNGFTNLTEFGRIEVMQKPGLCPFLHGPQTDKSIIMTLENAFKEQKSEHVEVILYKKNLTPLCILVELIPIRNDEDLVVLFLITFRDLTAFRQPLKEESAQTSALGAFAAASDAGSSWGKFARLVFAMVRQKAENSITDNPEKVDSPQLNIENETVQCVQMKSTEKQQNQQSSESDKNINNTNELTTTNDSSNNNNSNSNNKNDEIELIIPLNQRNQRKSTKSCHHYSTSDIIDNLPSNMISSSYMKSLNKLESGELNLYNLEIKSRKHKHNIFKKRVNKKSNNTVLNSKKLGNIKGTNINGDVDDLFSNQWPAPESVPRYRPEPPCPPKHVLLHYSVFRIVWDWTILLLTGYTAIIVPLRVAVIPRPAWIPSSESLNVRTNNQKEWIHPTTLELLTITDAIIDIIFGVDIVLNFHTSFVGAGGEVVADPPVIRMNYLSGWFTLDLLACLPYEILKYCWPVNNTEVYYLMDALRIIRLLRIGRAARRIDQYLEYVSTLLLLMILCFFLLAHWFACAWYAVGIFDIENKIYYGWIPRIYNDSLKPQNWEEFTLYDNSLTVSMINLNKTQLLNQHITSVHNSVLNFALINSNSQSTSPSYIESSTSSSPLSSSPSSSASSMKSKNHFLQLTNTTNCSISNICINETLQNDTTMTKSLKQQEYNNNNIYHILSSSSSSNLPLQNSKEKWTAYITALYFSLSLLTTIGFGNVAAFTESEKLLSICCMLIGALVYATIFGNVTTIVQQMYATRTRYNEMMKGVKDFLKIHEVPRELGERVIDYITSSWSVTKGIDTVKVLNYCPKDMQADISVHLNRCVFNSHAAFRLASDGCRRSLAVNFQTLHTAPGDLICHQGESVDQLCFIASGTLEVLQDDEVIAILGKGDVFGDPLWKNTVSVPAAASVRALTYCTLHTIRLDRLRVVLNFYHAFANSFTRNLELTYNLCNRVIFRKLSDVRREMELSMRNKEPPLSSLPANHPVRKLISRFRRSSQVGDLSSRQYLGTIVSYNTSLDGSEFENSSISDIMANSTADKPGSICKSPLPGTHNDPKITTPLSSPVKVTHKNSIDLQPQSEPPVVTASSLKGQNPARKWARLISKATQPPLHNLNEEPNEDSSRLPSTQAKNLSEIQLPTKFPDDQNFTSTPVTTVVSLTSDQNPIIVSTQTLTSFTSSINTISTINSTNLTPSIPCQDLHRIELNIEKCFDKFHIKLSQQINEIVKRLDSLEGQIVELRNTFHNPTNTSITESKIDHSQPNTLISTNNNNSKNNNNNTGSTTNNHISKICIK
ncbi:unnamed protein product [Schistosoma rodhaini]|nr:unnamed protein product [Schistosoma rodhaini]CAH8522896.1 unnamed protein product [Schistosoma rodhaini]